MTKIVWSKWSAIAEILSAVAVVVTLLYLAVQTRELRVQTEQNNEFLQEQNSYNVLQNQISGVEMVVNSEEIAVLLYGQDDVDYLRRLAAVRGILYRWQWEYGRFEDGVIDQLPVEAFRRTAERIKLAEVWPDLKSDFRAQFSDWVDAQLLKH